MNITRGAIVGLAGGAIGLVCAVPAAAVPDGPLLSGTYNVVGQYRAATADAVMHISSGCGGCDAVATSAGNSVTLTWTGAGWTSMNAAGGCGPTQMVVTPSNPTGVVQNFTSVMTWLQPEICAITQPGLANGTRISD